MQVSLRLLSLVLNERTKIDGRVQDFLARHAGPLGIPEDDPQVGYLLGRVWPDGAPGSFYASNVAMDPDDNPNFQKLLLRPVTEGPAAASYGAAGFTLGLNVMRKQGRMVIRYFELTPHVPRRHFEARISGPVYWNNGNAFVQDYDWLALQKLPFHRAHTARRLAEWEAYLDWKEKLVKHDQVGLVYDEYRWEGETNLEFLVRADGMPKRGVHGAELGALPLDDEDEPHPQDPNNPWAGRRRRPRAIKLGEVDGVRKPKNRPDHRVVVIAVEEDRAEALRERGLPGRGRLASNIAGDMSTLNNQRNGIRRLRDDRGFCPRLADFVFDSQAAGAPPGPVEPLEPIPGTQDLNEGQALAVAKVLAAPDLCLIQGPPGTGKTTVIAEICLRVAGDRGRVLVASQTNLAVDNALGRLAALPEVRRLRLGNASRVDEEYKDFLADHVVDYWFSTIGSHCQERVAVAKRAEKARWERRQALGDLQKSLDAASRARADQRRSQGLVSAAEDALGHARNARDRARDAADLIRASHQRICALRAWATDRASLPVRVDLSDLGELEARVRAELGVQEPREALGGLDELLAGVATVDAFTSVLASAEVALRDGSAGSNAEEVQRLRVEKRRLMDSVDDDDMLRLAKVNRRLKRLESEGWASITKDLARMAGKIWRTSRPPSVQALADALRPSTALGLAIEEARTLVADRQRRAASADVLRVELADLWTDMAAGLAQQRETAEAELADHEAAARAADEVLEGHRAALSEAGIGLQAATDSWAGALNRLGRAGLGAPEGPPSRALLRQVQQAVAEQDEQASSDAERAQRWRRLQEQWIDRVANVSESDRDHLQQLYVKHANVVGMTCNEAGKKQTWDNEDFEPFDLVIIDEVSKATPTELIMPMLLGRKVVLVGDHRQLPPMFRERESSYGEAMAEGLIQEEDFERFRKMVTSGLFEELFEQAPEPIKEMLWTQYRMHPQVMEAVNQFYGQRLQAGPDQRTLDALRQHHLAVADGSGGRFLEPRNHLLWLDSSKDPNGKPHYEQQAGSSKVNILEVDLIVDTLRHLGRALSARGYQAPAEFEVPAGDQPVGRLVQAWLGDVPEETVADLFAERRVRLDGRAQKPDVRLPAGAQVRVDARKQVGIITFYGAQLREIRRAMDWLRRRHPEALAPIELRSNTVDRFQGMERPIIIASLVRSKKGRLGNFVREYQRINVGLSRAQQLLIVVGASETFKRAVIPLPPLEGGEPEDEPAYQNIIEIAQRAGGRRHAWQVLHD